MPQAVATDPLLALISRAGPGRPPQPGKSEAAPQPFAEALSAQLRSGASGEGDTLTPRPADPEAETSPAAPGGALPHPTSVDAHPATPQGAAAAPGLALGHILGRALGRARAVETGMDEAGPARAAALLVPQASPETPRSARGRILPAGAAEIAAGAMLRRSGAESGRGSSLLSETFETRAAGLREGAEPLLPPGVDRTLAGEALRPLGLSDRPGGLPPGLDATAALAGTNGRAVAGEAGPGNRTTIPMATPFGQAQWANELGEKLVWLAGRQGHLAELQLSPPALGSLEVRLSIQGNEAGAQFYSANAAVREAIEAALPRLRELLANAGLSLGGASVSSESFQTGASFAQDRRESADERGDAAQLTSQEPMLPLLRRVGTGLIDLYA